MLNAEPYRSEPAAVTLGANRKHCHACANILDVRAELCPRCGVRQPQMMGAAPMQAPPIVIMQPPVPQSTRSKGAAALLAFFLGGIGGHKFYLGQTGAGIVYLLFCWTLIPAFVAFIELLILLTMSDADFNRRFP